MEIVGAVGLTDPAKLTGKHITRRVSSTRVLTLDEQFPQIPVGCLFRGDMPAGFADAIDHDDDSRITVHEFRQFVHAHRETKRGSKGGLGEVRKRDNKLKNLDRTTSFPL